MNKAKVGWLGVGSGLKGHINLERVVKGNKYYVD